MADVDPVGDGAVLVLAMLHDALVELGVIDYPIHPITEKREGLLMFGVLAQVPMLIDAAKNGKSVKISKGDFSAEVTSSDE